MKKYFVTFNSPGTLFAEQTTKEINGWDVEVAVEMSMSIKERHGSLPYGFYFTTRERSNKDLDSKITKTSNMYYLGGEIKTLEELKSLNDPTNEILIKNMEYNGCERVIENNNSWRWTQPLKETDVVLNYSAPGNRHP